MGRILLLTLLVVSCAARAQNPLIVGILEGSSLQKVRVEIVSGYYAVNHPLAGRLTVQSGEAAEVSVSGDGWQVTHGDRTAAGKGNLHFSGTGMFRIVPTGQKPTGRIYQGELIIRNSGGRLRLLNRLDVEDYLPGVIEAEAGPGHEKEYYKVQAIISRTYALQNMRRHEAEGFNVCDQVHCQVYHGHPRFVKEGIAAVEETRDIVIVDDEINLITAAFHSNCGGHTVNAEHVWSKPLSYCVGRRDTFCLVMPHSNWEKTIPLNQWTSYLQSKHYPQEDSLTASALAYFPPEKEIYFVDQSTRIPLRTIRSDLKLRSAFFTVHQEGEHVRIIGQGFGHGVGLCQEGAMRMAQLGYSHKDIIRFYYREVHLVPRRFIWFFKSD
jgi:stage II sporulation protein D